MHHNHQFPQFQQFFFPLHSHLRFLIRSSFWSMLKTPHAVTHFHGCNTVRSWDPWLTTGWQEIWAWHACWRGMHQSQQCYIHNRILFSPFEVTWADTGEPCLDCSAARLPPTSAFSLEVSLLCEQSAGRSLLRLGEFSRSQPQAWWLQAIFLRSPKNLHFFSKTSLKVIYHLFFIF